MSATLYQLLALDLDGTLLDPRGEVSQQNYEAVLAAQQTGVKVVLASGRAPREIREIHRYLSLTTPFIAIDGAIILNHNKDRILVHNPLPHPIVHSLHTIIHRHDPAIEIHHEMQHGLDDSRSVHRSEMIGGLESPLTSTSIAINKLWFTGQSAAITAIQTHIQAELHHACSWLAFDDISLSLYAKGTSKAHALQWLAARYGIPVSQIMAIGDNINDLEMLHWAGLGIAMANAHVNIRTIAKAETCSNSDHGVARAIERWILR
ncbi:MAG: Cof-type HAD-IIB family hydrolase [Chloroflexi bacterium]|nr:Cof-type HAD-IIB family hydrolase [Chloroflexota bacterium]